MSQLSSQWSSRPILVTGAAGFIGAALCERLLQRGDRVIGIDNLNDYYDPALKQARLARLEALAPSKATGRVPSVGFTLPMPISNVALVGVIEKSSSQPPRIDPEIGASTAVSQDKNGTCPATSWAGS